MTDNYKSAGNAKGAVYMAFGDDSSYKGCLSFAYVVLKRTKVRRILREIRQLKQRLAFPDGVDIHLRILNSSHQREKYGLSHIGKLAIESLCNNLVSIINRNDVIVRYAHCREDEAAPLFKEIKLLDPITGQMKTAETKYDPKGVLGLLAHLGMTDYPGYPLLQDTEVYISPDQTQVKFLGPNRRQAHFWASGYSLNDQFYFQPHIGDGGYSGMMELADFAAYITCHGVHGLELEPYYFSLMNSITYRVCSKFGAAYPAEVEGRGA